jgi:hypothetical protein
VLHKKYEGRHRQFFGDIIQKPLSRLRHTKLPVEFSDG